MSSVCLLVYIAFRPISNLNYLYIGLFKLSRLVLQNSHFSYILSKLLLSAGFPLARALVSHPRVACCWCYFWKQPIIILNFSLISCTSIVSMMVIQRVTYAPGSNIIKSITYVINVLVAYNISVQYFKNK